MTSTPTIDLLDDARVRLGESPVWDPVRQCLWWIDCMGHTLHGYSLSDGPVAPVPLGRAVHAIGVRAKNRGLVAAMADGFFTLDPDTGETAMLCAPPGRKLPDLHFNDGKCGPDGRFWVGSMHRKYQGRQGHLFRVGADGATETLWEGFTVPNGPGWSPDGESFYIADSPTGIIFRHNLDADDGSIGPRESLAKSDDAPGWPDGMAVDAEGCLWSARWEGGAVVRFTPDGAVDQVIAMPVSRPTSCAFAGPDLDLLIVTSGWAGLNEADRTAEPHAGSLFVFRPGVTGAPVGLFSD